MPHTTYEQQRNPLPDTKPESLTANGDVWKAPWETRQFYSGETISFSTKRNSWGSRYSFTPTCYMTVKNELLSSNMVAHHPGDIWWFVTARIAGILQNFWCNDGKSGWNSLSHGWKHQPFDCKSGYVGYMHDLFAEGKQPFITDFAGYPLYEFEGNQRIWKHDVNPIYGKFYQDDRNHSGYGITTRGEDSFIKVVANDNPSSIKDYHSISLESPNKHWRAEITTNERRGGFIDTAVGVGGSGQYYAGNLEPLKKLSTDQYGRIGNFQTKEGYQYSPMPRDQRNITPSRMTLIGRLQTKPNRNPNNYSWPFETDQAYNLNPYTPDGEWTGGQHLYLQGGTGEDFQGEKDNDYWDVQLFGPLISDFGHMGENREVFFGKTFLSTTGMGLVHSAFRFQPVSYLDPPPENWGYAGVYGNQDNLLYSGGAYNYLNEYVDNLSVYSIGKFEGFLSYSPASAPMTIMSYNKTEIVETDITAGRLGNSIRLRLPVNFIGRNSYEVGEVGYSTAFPNEVMQVPSERAARVAALKYIQEHAIPDFETIVPDMNYDLDDTYNYSELELNKAGWIGVYVLESSDGEVLKGPSATIKLSVPGGFEPVSLSAINVEYKNTKLDGSLG
jgi:hypothetical protein